MKPILVCLHIFYPEMWPELKKYVLNVAQYPFELYVTMVKHDLEIENDIRRTFSTPPQFKNANNVHIRIVENRGYDCGPFIEVLNQVNLDQYSYVVKLHTKRNLRLGARLGAFDVSGAKWRRYLLNFCATQENFEKTLQAFEQNPLLGMTSDFRFLSFSQESDIVAHQQALKLLQKLKLTTQSFTFVAGTVFICRAKLLKPLQKLKLKISDFESSSAKVHGGQLAHAVERLLGYVVTAQGFIIKDVCNHQVYIFAIMKECFKHILFSKRMNRKGYVIYKICGIPVFKIFYKN